MTVTLTDIATATSDYLHTNVEVKVARVTGNLEAGEAGTLTVRVTNAGAPTGVRLTELYLHLAVDPGRVAQLKAPGSALLFPRATADLGDPRLPQGSLVDELFVFFQAPGGDIEPNATLDVGEVLELPLEFEAVGAGRATFSAHVHASVDVDDLFPGSRGADGEKDVEVLA